MTIEKAKKYIENASRIDFDSSFNLSKEASELLSDPEKNNLGRELVIRILDAWDKIDNNTYPLWADLVEAAGLYPYISYTDNNKLSGAACLRHEYHKSDFLENKYLHEEQMQLSLLLNNNKSVIASAPTSFGKSLLIEEIVASKKYNNIVIIQPTLALLDETRKKLQKYNNVYNIIVSTSQEPTNGRNLFLFTGERVVEYQHFPQIDFFVLDEFYKLSPSRDDDRAPILNHALYKLLKMTRKFYMLGPSIKSIPTGFTDQYEAQWYKSNFSTVAVDIKSIHGENTAETVLFKLLQELKEPTLIYCSSPDKANKVSSDFLSFLQSSPEYKVKTLFNTDLIQWIDKNIHRNWNLRNALANGIGVHHGALPRHLSSSIVDSFNSEEIKYLFCTSTLIEGVNTSAKNVVLFSRKKGVKSIDFFDFKNISGRAGRMAQHFIGKVYKFHPEPEQLELDVDIPLFNQEGAPLELLVQIKPEDLKTSAKEKLAEFGNLDVELKELLIKNSGVPIKGQLDTIAIIQDNFDYYYPLLNWSNVPTYNQLSGALKLCWDNLLKKNESRGGALSPKQLAFMTLSYYRCKSLGAVINESISNQFWITKEPDNNKRLQKVIENVLQVSKHWFDYKLPKLLSSLSNLQGFICRRHEKTPGDYSFFATQIENEFVKPNLTILLDYNIPVSAIRKLSKFVPDNISSDKIATYIKSIDTTKLDLLPYERRKIEML